MKNRKNPLSNKGHRHLGWSSKCHFVTFETEIDGVFARLVVGFVP